MARLFEDHCLTTHIETTSAVLDRNVWREHPSRTRSLLKLPPQAFIDTMVCNRRIFLRRDHLLSYERTCALHQLPKLSRH